MKRLCARVVRVEQLSRPQRDDMFALLQTYYEGVCFEVFENDLEAKEEAILLEDTEGRLRGFSTLTVCEMKVAGARFQVAFSGDTIVEKDCWGQTALQRAFVWRMLQIKCRRPFLPLYWFLISKGYKTYLLMAHNFVRFFPRVNGEASLKPLLVACARSRFGSQYSEATGLIHLEGRASFLKQAVAPIPSKLLRNNPHVRHFVELNPTWEKGTELACLADFSVAMVLKFVARSLFKKRAALRPVFDVPASGENAS